MSDLDQGFWKFCTSYNVVRPFIASLQNDTIFRHFIDRMGGGYFETTPGTWSPLANRVGMTMDMDLSFGARPFSPGPRKEHSARGRGVFYRASFSVAHSHRCFRTGNILSRLWIRTVLCFTYTWMLIKPWLL